MVFGNPLIFILFYKLRRRTKIKYIQRNKIEEGVLRDTATAEANFRRPGPNIYIQASKWLAEIRRITAFVFVTRITPF